MASLNKVCLLGNLGKDPEIRSMQSGARVANFSVATSESWKDKNTGEKREQTEWHRVVCFNDNLSKIIEQYLRKGSKVYIEGALKTRKWTDKDGVERYTTEIVLQAFNGTLLMLSSSQGGSDDRSGGEQRQSSAQTQRQAASRQPAAEDDSIPF